MKNNHFSVSIVIPNYNGAELLRKNLPAVIESWHYSANQITEVVVVDDGSVDDSVSLLKSLFPEVKLIKHKVNRGFPSAVNTGVRMAKGELVVLLNTDVTPSVGFLKVSLPHFEDEKVFAVSFHEQGDTWDKGYFREGYVVYEPQELTSKTRESFWANGGSAIFRRVTWMKLGGMDEKLFSPFYWEDIDLSYRARKAGYRILWEPNSLVIHESESTMKKLSPKLVSNIRERNQLLFIWKNISSRQLMRKHLVGLFARLVKHPGYSKIILMALVKLPLVMKARRKLRREEKISDEAVFAFFKS